MRTVLAVSALLLVLVGGYLLMWRGWRRRQATQADLPPLPAALPEADAVLAEPVDAAYVGTTGAGDWLDRVSAHTLGRRSPALVSVSRAGVTLDRAPEPALAIPATQLRAVRLDRAGGGRAVRRAEYLVLTWQHGDHLLDTVVRPRRHDDLARLLEATSPLVTQGATS